VFIKVQCRYIDGNPDLTEEDMHERGVPIFSVQYLDECISIRELRHLFEKDADEEHSQLADEESISLFGIPVVRSGTGGGTPKKEEP
jgi:hypothetical protein